MDVSKTYELGQQFTGALRALEERGEAALDAMVELFSPEARLTNAALKLANEERNGHDGVRRFWTEYIHTFRAAQTEFFEVTASPTAAGLFWTTRGSDAQGEPIEYDGVSLLVFDEVGKITLFRGYYDTRELSRRVSAG